MVSTQIQVKHTTGYTYPLGANASFNEARMTPRNSPEQFARFAQVDVSPPAWTYNYVDYWGTSVTAFEVHERHNRLKVVATSVVETNRQPVRPMRLDWAQLDDPAFTDRHVEMLTIGEQVDPGPELAGITAELRARAVRPGDLIEPLVDAIAEKVAYVQGATGVHTRATEVWEAGAGVCQDRVHLMVGALRGIGIPARYVSGYVMPSAEPVPGVSTVGESHSWVQYYDGGWVGIDPTNRVTPGDFHVEVGVGRDYFDVPPLRGIFRGPGTSEMYVEVEMTLLPSA